ncbi:DUF4203 domain-containing protein [Terrabacter carboxydivorans]|uniref:DUF4203 domain-containing protein n=1 Tax=Terrabacter carboxydivorans TaxID=619730 RepID=A0ABN3M2U6_9MICO
MSGWVVAAVGAVLCFAGIASLNAAVLVSAFGLVWLLVDTVGASTGTTLLVAAAGAVAAWVLVRLVFKTASFFVGALAGAVVGARAYAMLEPGGGNVVVGLVFVAAVGVLGGWLAARWSVKVLLVLTALGGAGLVLCGLGRSVEGLAWLRAPDETYLAVVDVLLWLVLAALGWVSQRRISARRVEGRSPRR